MLKRLLLGAAVVAVLSIPARPTHASEPYACIVYEDDSFVCGTVAADTDDGYVTLDRTVDWVSGCIPGGACDDGASPPTRRHRAR